MQRFFSGCLLIGWMFFLSADCLRGADTLTIVYSFAAPHQGMPWGNDPALIRGQDNNFYGTTYGDDASNGADGTIFRLAPDGTLTTLHTFNKADGAYPTAALLQARDGNFYGTTSRGGEADQGTVFRLLPDGTLTTLHSFGFGPEGSGPNQALVQGSDGNFYGTTSYGGMGNSGTVYRLTPDGTFSIFHNFDGSEGGPAGALLQASDGNFYGMTGLSHDLGSIYRLTPDGTLTTLHRFVSFDDGAYPVGALIQGSDGNLYGVTYGGGPDNGGGSVFRLTLDGTLTTLHSFSTSPDGYTPDGREPAAGAVQGNDGNLYGTTSDGYENDGTSFSGTVFRLGLDGTLTTLHKFRQFSFGGGPATTLVQGSDGLLYGTTVSGEIAKPNEDGTVFRVTTDSVAPTVSVPPVSPYPTVDLEGISSDDITDTQLGGFQISPSAAQSTDIHVNYKVTGTAVSGVDYVALKGVAKIKAGKAYKNINLVPIAIPHVPGRKKTVKTVKITLLPGEGYELRPEFTTRKVKITHP